MGKRAPRRSITSAVLFGGLGFHGAAGVPADGGEMAPSLGWADCCLSRGKGDLRSAGMKRLVWLGTHGGLPMVSGCPRASI